MSKLVFDKTGERFFEAGVSECVLFKGTPASTLNGVAWNGITSIAVTPDGGDANSQYADDIKYITLRGTEDIGGTIEGYHYPDEFEECMGNKGDESTGYFAQQKKSVFSFCWKTKVGNDQDGTDYSEKLHIIWNATVNPVEITYESLNDSPEPISMSWEYTTTPLSVSTDGYKSTAYFSIEKTTANATKYAKLVDKLYGTDPASGQTSGGTESTLLLPDDVLALLAA